MRRILLFVFVIEPAIELAVAWLRWWWHSYPHEHWWHGLWFWFVYGGDGGRRALGYMPSDEEICYNWDMTKTKPETPKYWVSFTEHHYQIEPPEESDDQWRFQGRSGLNVTINGISRDALEGFDVEQLDFAAKADDIPKGETAWVVVVEYTDGGTFGSSGYWTIPAVKADEHEADQIARDIRADKFEGYTPWQGYFAHIQDIRIEPHRVGYVVRRGY